MIKNVHEISEDLYRQYDFNRLLRILQRFASQIDELKRGQKSIDDSTSENESQSTVQSGTVRKRSTPKTRSTAMTKRKRTSGICI